MLTAMSLRCRRLSRQEYDAFCSTTEGRGCDSQRWAQHCSTLGASAAEGLKLKEFEQLYLDSRFQKHHGLQVQDLRLSIDGEHGWTPLTEAAALGNAESVGELLAARHEAQRQRRRWR